MADSAHPAATHHMPSFITAPVKRTCSWLS